MEREILNLDEARHIIEPYHPKIIDCINKGFDTYLEVQNFILQNPTYIKFEKRTKAGIIHDIICSHVDENFKYEMNIDTGKYNGIYGINIHNKLFIRFKKMDKFYNVSAYKTKQHKKYLNQRQIDGFPEKPTFLFAGYIPDETWTGLKGIYVACWNGETLLWFDEAGKYYYEQLYIPYETSNKVELEIEKKVRLSKGLIDKKGTGTNN